MGPCYEALYLSDACVGILLTKKTIYRVKTVRQYKLLWRQALAHHAYIHRINSPAVSSVSASHASKTDIGAHNMGPCKIL